MSAEQDKALVRRLVVEAQQNGNLEVVDEILAPDFVDHTPLPGVPPTRDGVKGFFAAIQAAIPDLRIEILDQIAEGGGVATRKKFIGTHGGPFLGVPASGRPVDFEVIDILRARDGRITDHWVVVDKLGLLTQLGAMPAE
ncbi:MAG TPA: ester cyclase [Thermoanaerobaculia bacterium]|nr:ester cyclase [Thermoanaerobaculia bacterium]